MPRRPAMLRSCVVAIVGACALALAAPASGATEIRIVQDTRPDSPQVFSYTAGGGLSPTSFQLDDDGFANNQIPKAQRFFPGPGSGYSVSQDTPTPAGYDPPEATCSDGSSPSNIDLSLNETVICTFANELSTAGRITIVKDAQPDSFDSFGFVLTGPTPPGQVAFNLVDDGFGSENSASFVVNPGGGYILSESHGGNWAQQSATCSDGSAVTSITIDPDENVVCTFVNYRFGQIRVKKEAHPRDPQDFAFTAGGGLSPSTFSLDYDADPTLSSARLFSGLQPGSGYSIAEDTPLPPNWQLDSATCSDGSPPSNIDLSPGEIVECFFLNEATDAGTITVRKDAEPDSEQAFVFDTSIPDISGGVLTMAGAGPFSEKTFNARPGTYSLSERATSGWVLASQTCSDGSPVSAIAVSTGENVVCTFVNNQHGSITVVKDAEPNGTQDFAFTPAGFGSGQFLLDDDATASLPRSRTFSVPPGFGYAVSESPVAGWVQSSATCSDGSPVSNISIAPGEPVICTFVNNQRGRLIVHQQTQPDDPQDFSFDASGSGLPAGFQLDDDGNDSNGLSSTADFTNLDPGSYSISQDAVAGYDLTDATCTDGSRPSAIDIAYGETVECTFTNLAPSAAAITVVKDASPDSAAPFYFSASGAAPGSFALDDDGDDSNARPSSRTLFVPNPGPGHSVSENLPPGWEQTSATCSDGSSVASIDVSAGERVTCTFVNTRVVEYLGYPRPKGATPFYAPLVHAYGDCEFPNRRHADPFGHLACNPPSLDAAVATSGSPDSNGSAANLTGSVKLSTRVSPVDVVLTVSVIDVRCTASAPSALCGSANTISTSPDYIGDLRVRGIIRATDKLNGSDPGGPSGTVADVGWGPTVPCAANATATIGSTCALATTFNALIPGSVQTGARSIWELGEVSVFDGGPDGDGDTPSDNTPFLRQGIFVP